MVLSFLLRMAELGRPEMTRLYQVYLVSLDMANTGDGMAYYLNRKFSDQEGCPP